MPVQAPQSSRAGTSSAQGQKNAGQQVAALPARQQWRAAERSQDLRVLPSFPSIAKISTVAVELQNKNTRLLSAVEEKLSGVRGVTPEQQLNALETELIQQGRNRAAQHVALIKATSSFSGKGLRDWRSTSTSNAPWDKELPMPTAFIAATQLAKEEGLLVNLPRGREFPTISKIDEICKVQSSSGKEYTIHLFNSGGSGTGYGFSLAGGAMFVNSRNCKIGVFDGSSREAATIANELAAALIEHEYGLHMLKPLPGDPILIAPPLKFANGSNVPESHITALSQIKFDSPISIIETVSDSFSFRVSPQIECQRLAQVYLEHQATERLWQESNPNARNENSYSNSARIFAAGLSTVLKPEETAFLDQQLKGLVSLEREKLQLRELRQSNPNNHYLHQQEGALNLKFSTELKRNAVTVARMIGQERAASIRDLYVYYETALLDTVAMKTGKKPAPLVGPRLIAPKH